MEINFGSKECNVKIVYYGPGLSGKTTNLEIIHQKTPESNRGKLTALATDMDRTLYFDYMPIDLGKINGLTVRLRLFTVPGQVFYNATRKIVLRCVDGVVFVADSQENQRKANIESFENLRENLLEQGLSIEEVPLVLQYNKRDLPTAVPFEVLDGDLKFHPKIPSYGAVAPKGDGVFQCLKAIANLTMAKVEENVSAKPRSTQDKDSQKVGASLASAKPSESFLQKKKQQQEVEITQKRFSAPLTKREAREEKYDMTPMSKKTTTGQDFAQATTHLGQNKGVDTTHFPKVGQPSDATAKRAAVLPSFPGGSEAQKHKPGFGMATGLRPNLPLGGGPSVGAGPVVGEKKAFVHQPFHKLATGGQVRPPETHESKEAPSVPSAAREPLKNFSGFLDQRKAPSAPASPIGPVAPKMNKFSMPLFQGSLSSGESLASGATKKNLPLRPAQEAIPVSTSGKILKKEEEEE